jgi:hypothetical protein
MIGLKNNCSCHECMNEGLIHCEQDATNARMKI